MGIRFSNNAKTNLAASITATDLILTVTPTTGAKFPVLIGTDDNYCVVTLEDAAGNREFVKVSRRTSDTLGDGTYPCVRGYWGSTPRVWASATTTVDIRWAADAVQDYLQNISGRYLGAYAADPTTDNFGAALKTGDLYYDTAGSALKKYASGAWGSAYLVNAAGTTFTPAGGLAATNVQAALQELDSEKANASALSSYQAVAGMSAYQTVAGMSAYQTVAGMSSYQTVAGMSSYQTVAGMSSYMPKTGGVFSGDITMSRVYAPNTGVVFFGNTGARYLYFDGTNYVMPGAGLVLNSTQPVSAVNTCKAWVLYNGATGGIITAFNVSSITRNAVGDHTINFSNALDSNFVWAAAGNGSIGNGTSCENEIARSTTALRIGVVRFGTVADPTIMMVIVFGA